MRELFGGVLVLSEGSIMGEDEIFALRNHFPWDK